MAVESNTDCINLQDTSTPILNNRELFRNWLVDGNTIKYSPEVIINNMDRISEYTIRKKITACNLWEYNDYDAFNILYNKLTGTKFFSIINWNTHRGFMVAGLLYLRFLKEKPFTSKESITILEDKEAESAIEIESLTQKPIDPENVISWLITQPNANGTLYLENVVRQYIGALRNTPAKLETSVALDTMDIFDCHTPDELSAYWEILKAAPNYKQVNLSTSGMFSAGVGCYMRYLQHITNMHQLKPEKQKNENKELQEIQTLQRAIPDTVESPQQVDFDRPELCIQSRPLSCSIEGRDVVLVTQNWSDLLVAITERFIADRNPRLKMLDRKLIYGNRMFFLYTKPNGSSAFLLSNGMWIYTNYKPEIIVKVIKNLCRYCGVRLDNVIITYLPRSSAPVRSIKTRTNAVNLVPVSHPMPELNPILGERFKKVLSVHFVNGYRLNSPIEMARFRSFAVEELCEEFTATDNELESFITACGTSFNGKVYVVSDKTKERIKELAEEYFANGAKTIFFTEFYVKNENWLLGASIVSESMLIEILYNLFPKLSFTQTYFGYTDVSVFTVLVEEILRVWNNDVLLSYGQLAERLQYIPMERIKYALSQNSDFIWNSSETFTHVSQIDITDEERKEIQEAVALECDTHGYMSIIDLPLEEIKDRNDKLSVTAIHDAVYRICLSDRFDKKGKIITRHGDTVDALTLMKEYCRTIEKCTLDDLRNFENELIGDDSRWMPLEAGNAILVRIDKDTYVADRYVHFDMEAIDTVIESSFKGVYVPLQSFTSFGAFPDCGQTWNLFLLESYCRRFSREFRFDTLNVNSRSAGAIIHKSCGMDYSEIMADAVANSDITLRDTDVGKFLFENGYTGRSTNAKINEIIYKAKAIRERMN